MLSAFLPPPTAAQLIMGTALFPLFQSWMSTEDAWRSVCAVPAFLVIIWACALTFISDDSPKGNYSKLKTVGAMPEVSAAASMAGAAKNWNTWILFVQYGCCFGVELTMNNIVASYLYDQFELDLVTAGVLASCYGLMNLFARSLGGLASDYASVKFGMRGRLWTLWLCQTLEGVLCMRRGTVVFSQRDYVQGLLHVWIVIAY